MKGVAISTALAVLLSISAAAAAQQPHELAKLIASDGADGDYFALEVDMSGTTIMAGAVREDSGNGAVYVYEQGASPNQWAEVGKVVLDPSFNRDEFGLAVDIDGDTAAMTSSMGAYIYQRNASQPSQWDFVTELVAPGRSGVHVSYGRSIALKGDQVIVGDYSAGAVIFDRHFGGQDQWGLVQTLTPSDTPPYHRQSFGHSVAIDGDTAVIGAPYRHMTGNESGAAYIFRLDGTWQETQIVIGADTGLGDRFGSSVAVDGNTIAISAEDDCNPLHAAGAVYVFERDGAALPWQQTVEIHQDGAISLDGLGAGLALEGDIIVAGSPGVDDYGERSGATFVFGRDVGGVDNWGQIVRLTASDGGAEDRLGTQVGLSGELIVAGAYYHPDSTNRGAAYVFAVPGPATLVLDIKPGGDPNSVNLKSKGLLPVVVYGSDELDLTEIDLDTLLLNGVRPRLMPDGSWHVSFEDVNGDLLLDLVMHFEMQALGIEPGTTELALTGELMDGTEFEGADAVRIVPDFNGDLMVNATDLAIMKHSYGAAGVGFELGDANADGFVDATDLALLQLDLGWTESAFGQPIPEPASLTLLALGGLALLRRRK